MEDFTSCGGALFGAFGGFNVLWGSAFWHFLEDLSPVWERFLGFSEDLTFCGGALFGTFGGSHALWARTILSFWSFLAEVDGFEDVLK